MLDCLVQERQFVGAMLGDRCDLLLHLQVVGHHQALACCIQEECLIQQVIFCQSLGAYPVLVCWGGVLQCVSLLIMLVPKWVDQ